MKRVVILTGGVGGAKLVLGACEALPAESVTAIVNTGDDFEHLGLAISPDIDTLLYTLSGQANRAQGWGREGETWNFMAAFRALGGADWFQLGDGDLAVHIHRTLALGGGATLSAVTAGIAAAWGVAACILPMSDDPVRTILHTDQGRLAFQDYFVARRAAPTVREIEFDGAAQADAAPGVTEAIRDPQTQAILIAPSNPYLSVDPILAVPAIRRALMDAEAPIVAVSPLVGGEAVKGPTAKLLRELGQTTDAVAVVAHYDGLVDGILIDERDEPVVLSIPHERCDTLMHDTRDRIRVVEAALALAGTIG